MFELIQNLIFIVIWIFLLLGIFILSREFIFQWKRSENLAIFGGFLVAVILMFEAILMLEEHKWRNKTLANRFFHWLTGEPETVHWKWHVNPLTVPVSLLGRIIVLLASIFGESSGKLVGRFLAELPIALSIFVVPFSFLCIFIGTFCIFGYQFNIGYGFLKIDNGNLGNRWKSIFRRGDAKNISKKLEVSKLDYCIRKVNEGYQKAILNK